MKPVEQPPELQRGHALPSLSAMLAVAFVVAASIALYDDARKWTAVARPSRIGGSGQTPAISVPIRSTQQVAGRPGAVGFLGSLFERINRHNLPGLAAGVAFYSILSIFPAFAALVSLYGLFVSPTHIMDTLSLIADLLPPEATKFLDLSLTSIATKPNSQLGTALAVSILLALWSARAGMSSLMTGLDVIYGEVDRRNFFLQIAISMLLTLAGIVLVLFLLLAVAVAPAVLTLVQFGTQLETLMTLYRWPLLAIVIALSFAVIYRFAPYRTHPRWRWITWGSATATLLWLAASALFSCYVSNFGNFDATYGSLGALAILLMWLWISAMTLMFGAEIDDELEAREDGTS